MATLHNPAEFDLTLYALETGTIGPVLVRAGGSVELTDEQARALKDSVDASPIFELRGFDEGNDGESGDSDESAEKDEAPRRQSGGERASSAPSRKS